MAKVIHPLRVLLVEDNSADAALIVRELERAGFAPDWTRVDTEADFRHHLQPNLDLILSDYSIPQFGGLRALELLREGELEIPFIIVSGTIDEEMAVAAMRSGASDYLLKDRLARLGPAVAQVLEQKRVREERQQAQETLNRLRLHHELILQSAGEGILGVDLDGNVFFENPKATELLGWKPSELIGRPVHATIHHTRANGTDYPIDACPIHPSVQDGGERRVSNDIFWRKNRTSFRVDFVSAPIKDAHGKITGSILTFQDVTEQFVSQMRLKLQEQQYRLVFETNPNPMWIYDTKTFRILAVNDAATAQYGYSREEMLELSLRDLRFPEDEAALKSALTPENLSEQFRGEFRHKKKDGSAILVEIYSGAILWTGLAARIVTAIDIGERRRAEERLREQADIIDRAQDAISIRNFADRRIVFWNSGAARVYGWTAAEILGTVGEHLFADPDQLEEIMTALVATGEFRDEVEQRTKDGRTVLSEGRAILVRNEDGSPRSVLSIYTDVTEKKKLEAQLLRAQRLESIGTLASGVAHDLNNILTPILICAQTIREGVSTEDLESAIALIESSAKRGASVVKQVLTFARGVEGERVVINPAHLVEEMIDIAQNTFPRTIEIRSKHDGNLWSIESDPTQMHQVLLNLAVNARDAMPNGGSLLFGVENFMVDEQFASSTPGASPGRYVMFSVADSGSGMSRDTIKKIFDPFFSTKEIGQGTGLGLSTTLGIIKSHGGFITVESREGAGTTFKVFLPARPNDESSYAPAAGNDSQKGDRELILAVDDEPAILRVVQTILEKHNYRVLVANDGAEAIEIFGQYRDAIKAVLTDIMMPRMDGFALIRALQEFRPDMLFIASGGQGEDEHLEEMERLGVAASLPKPYDAEELLQIVGEVVGRK